MHTLARFGRQASAPAAAERWALPPPSPSDAPVPSCGVPDECCYHRKDLRFISRDSCYLAVSWPFF